MTTSPSPAPAPAPARRRMGVLGVAPGLLVVAATVITGVVGINVASGDNEPYEAAVDAQVRREQALPEPEVRRLVVSATENVRLPHPHDEELVDVVVAAAPADAATVRAIVGKQLGEWNLRPGGTLVRNECPTSARACVDLDNRLAWLQKDGKVTYGPVPTIGGTVLEPTPRGSFTVVWKKVDDYSEDFEVEIPYAVYFTTNGIAFHEGALDEHSHGCLHLDQQDAPTFFDRLSEGDVVVVM